MSTKYIVYEDMLCDQIIIFGDTLEHRQVAIDMGVLDRVLSAGFLCIGINREGAVFCEAYGKSISLDVESRETEDSSLARDALNLD